MRRLARILWTTFAAISLACCLVAAGLRVRSYRVADAVGTVTDTALYAVRIDRGHIAAQWGDGELPVRPLQADREWRRETGANAEIAPWAVNRADWDWQHAGVRFASTTNRAWRFRLLAIPLAYVTGLFAMPPLAWLVVHFRRRRRRAYRVRAGLCASCGYDLRASAGRCPECGASRAELKEGRHGGRGGARG